MAKVSIGDVAGVIAALAFAYLVLRLGSLIGKTGKVVDEARIGVRGVSEQTVPLLSQVTDTVASTNEQIVRFGHHHRQCLVDDHERQRPDIAFCGDTGFPGRQGGSLHLRRALGDERCR